MTALPCHAQYGERAAMTGPGQELHSVIAAACFFGLLAIVLVDGITHLLGGHL